MKILYIITKSNWGGAQRHVYDLAIAMKEKDHNAIVALGGEGILRKKLEDAGIKTHVLSSMQRDISLSKDTSSFWDILKIIRREKPDIIHLHSTKVGLIGSLAGRILKIKNIIFTAHGWAFNEDRTLLQKLTLVFFSWLTILFSHKVIVISKREYDQAIKFPWVKNKINLIYLGIKQPVFMSIDGAKQFLAKTVNIDPVEFGKKLVIGTIAELHANKGLDYLLEAIQATILNHANILCLIIGGGEKKEELEETIKLKQLSNNVKLLGYIDEASHYLKAFNIFVLPSVKEGLPYVLLEAGYASLPVISTTVGGIPEIVEDMRSGVLVQTKNSRELAHALSFMIEHPSMRRQYGTALRESVMQKFSIDKMIGQVEDIYNK